jgi:quercetin dioxygenase-like cupin family protein
MHGAPARAPFAFPGTIRGMDTQRASEGVFESAPEAHFTGPVWVKHGPAPEDGSSGVVIVNFAPASRTHWHRHSAGQYLYVVEGRGRIRSRDEAGVEATPGDLMWVPPGEWHFHGAAPDAPMVHFAFNGEPPPEWGEAVSEAEYEEGF